MIGPKGSLRNFKNIEIIPSVFSDHDGMKLEINKKRAKKLNIALLNNQWVKE